MSKKIICILIAGIALSNCAKKNENAAIMVNGFEITKQDVSQAVEMLRQTMINAFPQKALEGMSPELTKDAAKQLVANQLMLDEAKKRNITVDSSVVDSSFKSFKNRFGDSAAFQNAISQMGETESSIRGEMKKGATLDKFLKSLLDNVDSVTVQECNDFYTENSSKYISGPRSRASQIFIPADTSDKVKWAQSKKLADDVSAKIKVGQKFEKLAAKFSKGPGVEAGGDIGWFAKGELRPDLEGRLLTLKTGEISEVITTELGFHIIMKTAEETGSQLPYDTVKDHVQMMVNLKKRNTYISSFVDSLIGKAKVVYIDTSLIPLKKESDSEKK
jgi:parvulin-like peptidyl-prolyl isomerase